MKTYKKPPQAICGLTDEELVVKFQKTGNNDFMGGLFERYAHMVYGICMKYLKNEAESYDMVMSIFEKLISEIHNHSIVHFKSWLYTVSKNYVLMMLRGKRKTEGLEEKILQHFPSDFMELEDFLHPDNGKETLFLKLEESIKKLNKEQGLCIELLYLKDKTYKEISEITGYPIKKVKSYVQNGKRNLTNFFVKNHEETRGFQSFV